MAKFPDPPATAELAKVAPDVRVLPKGRRVWRIYFQSGSHPTTWSQFRSWGPTDARFDHHTPPPCAQAREILYGATGAHAALTALAEVFQDTRVVERNRGGPVLVAFDLTRKLRLLDLSGTWPTKAGASMAINSGWRNRSRRWSRAIYEAYPDLDGLSYGSSMNANAPCVALFERATTTMPKHPAFHRNLSDPAILDRLRSACRVIGYQLV